MTKTTIDRGRRRFFSEFLRDRVVTPVDQARREIRKDARREVVEQVYESELRAFGPDVLAQTAKCSGITTDDVDYAEMAKALAANMEDSDDEPR